MKTFRILLSTGALTAAVLLATGCKSSRTESITTFYRADGTPIATHRERTGISGFLVRADSVKPSGLIDFTNTFTNADGLVVSVAEKKDFKADSLGYQSDADSIKAAGDAAGNVIGTAVKAATGH